MKNQKMIDYLTTVLELEKSCYEQNKILNRLAAQIKAYNNPKKKTDMKPNRVNRNLIRV